MKCILPLAILFSVYLGNVLGCLVLCETIPELRRAKEFVWKIPFIHLFYVIDVLLSFKREDRLQYLLWYLKTPYKNVLVSCAVVEAVKKHAAKKKKHNSEQSDAHVAQTVFKSFKGICAEAWSLSL